jgi:hypothetical protein
MHSNQREKRNDESLYKRNKRTDVGIFAQCSPIHGYTRKEPQSLFDATFQVFQLENIRHGYGSIGGTKNTIQFLTDALLYLRMASNQIQAPTDRCCGSVLPLCWSTLVTSFNFPFREEKTHLKHKGIDFFADVQITEKRTVLRSFNQQIQKGQSGFFCIGKKQS